MAGHTVEPLEGGSGQWAIHMSPVFGIAAGTFIAWFLAYCLGLLSTAGEVQHAIRLFGVITSVVMWALFTSAMQDKEIFGGGLISLNRDCSTSVRRVWLVRLWLFVGWAAALITISTHKLMLYWPISIAVLMIVVGEVGWRDPLCGAGMIVKGRAKK